MKRATLRPSRRNPRAWLLSPAGCISILIGVPVACLLVLIFVYILHNRPIHIDIPTPAPIANNAYKDFVRAAQMISGIQHKAPASMLNLPATRAAYFAECAACAKESAPALAVLRSALGKPCQCPPYRSYKQNPFPGFAGFREMAREITGVAAFYEMNGQPGGAADVLLDGEEMAVMFPRGGSLTAALVGIACESICLSRFEGLIPQLSSIDLNKVAARLDRICAKRWHCYQMYTEEKWTSLACLQEALNDPKLQNLKDNYEAAMTMVDVDASPPQGKIRRNLAAAKFMLADKQAMLEEDARYMDALAIECRRPYSGPSAVKLPNNPLASSFDLSIARPKVITMEAVLDLLRIEVALQQFKRRNGRVPGSLRALVPSCLNRLPDDPFGGGANRQFHYRLLNGGKTYLLYGLGPDLIDHGGTPGRWPGQVGTDNVAGRLWLSKGPLRYPAK